jgi:arginyl-tRNA synthetase
MLYVVGTPQELHFKQLVQSLLLMGFEWASRIVHVKFGHVHGMSTRRGEVVLLEDVLDEAARKAREKIEDNIQAGKLDPEADRDELAEAVGIGSIIAHDLKHRRERDISFDWDQVLQFDGETGPYLQYSYARIQGILRKAGVNPGTEVDFSSLSEPETRAVLRKLADFPGAVEDAANENEPSFITTYLFELTRALNIFYNHHRVVGSGEPHESARLLLVASTGAVLKKALELLGIPVLERM